MLVTAIGMSALMVTRIQRRTFQGTHDASVASDYADSAIELALWKIKQDANWRQTYTHNTWVADQTIDRGTFKWKLVDTVDTDLNNDDTHPVRLVAWGMIGQTTQKASVKLIGSDALTCLEVALHAGNDLKIGGDLTSSQIISSNNTVDAYNAGGQVNADVEAVNSIIGGGSYNGSTTTGITARTMPDPNTVFDHYIANGTTIAWADLPTGPGGSKKMQQVVLSPGSNPYGAGQTNPQGIYVIHCGGGEIRIQDARIVGTLVLLNVASSSEIKNTVVWEPAVANYPALLVQGDMSIFIDSAGTLDESIVATPNLNPPGAPYNGQEDSDEIDVYPCSFEGLVYVSNNLSTWYTAQIQGPVVVGNTYDLTSSTFTVSYDPTYLNNPPPGFFAAGEVRIESGSWNKEVD